MRAPEDLRASERIPVEKRVKVGSLGKMSSYALVVNISLGGLLLTAAPTMPIGSPCKLAILLTEGANGRQVMAEGTVVRSDASGTAIKFASVMNQEVLGEILGSAFAYAPKSILESYMSYFKVSQSKTYDGCEQLLGVSKKTFRSVFVSTFYTCIPLAILPVWGFHSAYMGVPNWLKIVVAFGYALFWFALIQPMADLTIFKFIREKNLHHSKT